MIGKLGVAEITRQDILRISLPIRKSNTETAHRVRGRLETIFDWFIREGYREKENPARWRGQLAFDLPSKEKKFTKFSATHLHLFVELCQQSPSATRALVVDAKDETALDFYLRLNFFRLSETSLRAVLLSPKRTL